MKENTAAVHAQVPVDVATFLLNEKRTDIAKLEARQRVSVVLIPNKFLETPHYSIERLRHDDERLDTAKASYDRVIRAADRRAVPAVAQPNRRTDAKRPWSKASSRRPRHRSSCTSRPCPPPPRRSSAPAREKSFWARLVSWFAGDELPRAKAQQQATSAGVPGPATGRGAERGRGGRNEQRNGGAQRRTRRQPRPSARARCQGRAAGNRTQGEGRDSRRRKRRGWRRGSAVGYAARGPARRTRAARRGAARARAGPRSIGSRRATARKVVQAARKGKRPRNVRAAIDAAAAVVGVKANARDRRMPPQKTRPIGNSWPKAKRSGRWSARAPTRPCRLWPKPAPRRRLSARWPAARKKSVAAGVVAGAGAPARNVQNRPLPLRRPPSWAIPMTNTRRGRCRRGSGLRRERRAARTWRAAGPGNRAGGRGDGRSSRRAGARTGRPPGRRW